MYVTQSANKSAFSLHALINRAQWTKPPPNAIIQSKIRVSTGSARVQLEANTLYKRRYLKAHTGTRQGN